MELTEEQRKQAEANRLAAIAKRKALIESSSTDADIHYQHNQTHSWRLTKCPKLLSDNAHNPKRTQGSNLDPFSNAQLPKKFRARLEICSPDSFSITPEALQGCLYGECLRRLSDIVSDVMPSHYTQNTGGGKASVYKIKDYGSVLSCLRKSKDIEIKEIPHLTLRVVEAFSRSFISGKWIPCRPEHLSEEDVDQLIVKLPRTLLDALLPFQLEGIRFGLQRGGRCLIADEMGLGKTLQAIAIAGSFMNEGSILIVCPAVLRYTWAEELERWLPFCLPSDIHLVFGHRDNPAYLTKYPRVVVISYTMLKHLRSSMLEREWALLIVDESHHLRCSQKASESGELQTVLDLAEKIKRIVLLSGTPSLSRPGLLGETKYKFAETYCAVNFSQKFKNFSKGVRLQELNLLLSQTVMIRRLKEHVLAQLPPKRRQLIRLQLKRSDIASAKAAVSFANADAVEKSAPKDGEGYQVFEELSYQELGVAKLRGFREWFSIHPLTAKSDAVEEFDADISSHKMIIFAHHHKVLDGIQEFICEKGIDFVRIDGTTLPKDRQSAVLSFQSSNGAKIAIIGITAGGVGLNFSSAKNVVFLELPLSPSLMLQAEDRAHRRGQTSAVNIYIFCAKDTMDESHWKKLNKSQHHVSSTTNGKYDAMQEIQVEGISYLVTPEGNYKHKILRTEVIGKLPLDLEKLHESEILETQPSEAFTDVAVQMDDISNKINQIGGSFLQNDGGTDPDPQMKNDFILMGDGKELHPSAANVKNFDVSPPFKMDKGNEDQVLQLKGEIITEDDVAPIQPLDAECCSSPVESMRFEVSQYTGRIHLYSCIPGLDLRPRPLFENVRPDEIESEGALATDNKRTISKYFKDKPAYMRALLVFIDEWNKLRPIEQRKLCGKPLQLPLSIELCYLKESINHSSGGLLKGGSKRRTTPLCEISVPLPPNAIWKKVHLQRSYGKKEKEYTQGWTLSDEPLCKLCQKPCKGSSAKTPEYFEDLFCNLGCYEEYRLRTSNRSVREELFEIEHGICTNCKLDCHQLVKHLKPLSSEKRREYIAKVAPKIASQKSLVDRLVSNPSEGNAWHADHIIPVYRGGGECRLENMRTLCVACHADVTAAQCAERRTMRIKAKEKLKDIMSNPRNFENIENNASREKDQEPPGIIENIAEDQLLVNVPGSAYSEGISSNPKLRN